MDTKKETGISKQEVEKKYGLEKLEKTEFINQMVKELRKYEDKLHRIANYEEMQKQGKTVNQEMLNLVKQKPEIEHYLKALKTTMNIYIKAAKKPGEAEPVAAAPKDTKAELEEHKKEFAHAAAKRLAYFLAMGGVIADKEQISQSPVAHLPSEQENELAKAFAEAIHAPVEKDTSLQEEVERLEGIVLHLIEGDEGVAKIVEAAMKDSALGGLHYRLAAPKAPQAKEYSASAPISVGKDVVPEPKKEAQVPAAPEKKPVEVKEEAKPKTVEEPKVQPEAEKPKEAPAAEMESQWANQEFEDEEEEAPAAQEEAKTFQPYVPEAEQKEEEGFTIVTDKKKPAVGGRGRFPRRRRGGYPRSMEGGRGDFGGQRRRPYGGRGRGEGRGEVRGPRVPRQ